MSVRPDSALPPHTGAAKVTLTMSPFLNVVALKRMPGAGAGPGAAAGRGPGAGAGCTAEVATRAPAAVPNHKPKARASRANAGLGTQRLRRHNDAVITPACPWTRWRLS